MIINKLVRDNIPKILQSKGKKLEFSKVTDDTNYYMELCKKLLEESKEYIESDNLEEIVDILEVIDAIVAFKHYDWKEILALKDFKATQNGKFIERIYLKRID